MSNNFQNKKTPNGRPLSILGRSFSDSLDNAFLMSPEIESLAQSVQRKRQSVTLQQIELEQLEARIRGMEARLKERTLSSSSKNTADSDSDSDSEFVNRKAGKQEDLERDVAPSSHQERDLNSVGRKPPPSDQEQEEYSLPRRPKTGREKESNSSSRRPPTGHGRKQSTSSGAKRR